jgi:hypothetical protein
MSKISREGYEQITVIRNALDSMFDKLNSDFYTKADGKIKDIEKQYISVDVSKLVGEEFETIAGIIEESGTWAEVE